MEEEMEGHGTLVMSYVGIVAEVATFSLIVR